MNQNLSTQPASQIGQEKNKIVENVKFIAVGDPAEAPHDHQTHELQ